MASKKQIKKLIDKKCYFCSEDNYNLLDVHRIIPGSEGGKYHEWNTVVTCCKCHRLIHQDKTIVIDRKYMSTKGIILHYWRDGHEFWL